VTLRFGATVHWTVPDARCELPGAFAELKLPGAGVYVPGATLAHAAAENAMSAANGTAKMKRIRRNMIVSS